MKKRDRRPPKPAPASPPRPIVDASGQGWKVTLGIGGMVVAAAASILQLVGPEVVKQPAIGVAIVTGVLGILTIASVRCPACGLSLGVWAFRTGSLTTWRERLAQVATCPSCGHERRAEG